MKAETAFERRSFGRTIEVTFEEDEMPPTSGNRKRGSDDRREARIESVRLAYYWSFDKQAWVAEGMMSAVVSQRLAGGGWGEPVRRNVWAGRDADDPLHALLQQHAPTTTITIQEK